MVNVQPQGRGWLPDPPDSRDFLLGGDVPSAVAELISQLSQSARPEGTRSHRVDLRQHFEEDPWQVRDQGPFQTSSVFASIGLVEFFERITCDRNIDVSHAFLYGMARRIANARGDCGASLRNCFRGIRRFGAPPERYWPYEKDHVVGDAMDPFLYSYARDYEDTHYVRVCSSRVSGKKSLKCVRGMLAAGFAVACGFATPNRLPGGGDIPYRPDIHEITAGQGVILMGYDDRRRIGSETGALLFRSSWGAGWGENGYGWLPYVYVIERLATDFWTLMRRDWVEAGLATRRFRCPEFL